MSVGLQHFSSGGYNSQRSDSIPGTAHYTKAYYGDGNISQVYGGLSFNICNWLALGANVYYMWGDLAHTRTLTFTESNVNPTAELENLSVSNVRFRAGAQLFHTWGNHTINLGAIFENKMRLHSELMVLDTQTSDQCLYRRLAVTDGMGCRSQL